VVGFVVPPPVIAPSLAWVGTYPADGGASAPGLAHAPGSPVGRGEGLWRVDLTDVGHHARRIYSMPSPSFLLLHPDRRRLYAVSETSPGLLTVLRPSDDGLSLRSQRPSGGSFPCHLALEPGGRWLLVSHYGDGVVAAFPLDALGDVAGDPVLLRATGSAGPNRNRQDGPHAHCAVASTDGRFLLVADLGTDELRRYRLNGEGAPEPAGVACRLPPGSGPRHLAFRQPVVPPRRAPSRTVPRLSGGAASTVYVTLELTAEVAVLTWDPGSGSAELLARRPLVPAGYAGEASPSHVVVRGNRLFVATRGPDVIATFEIRPDGDLVPVAVTATVAWPRHFAVVGEWLVVAGERDNALGLHPLGGPGDVPEALGHRVPVPAPACVVDGAG
jgi:6-phosphogluconolactonase